MFNKNTLESTEFYNRRYSTYTTKFILPIFLFVVLTIVASTLVKREITVKSTGEIWPVKPLATVQSTSNNSIELNKLVEGTIVKKGQVLLTYKHQNETTNEQLLKSQLQEYKLDKKGLQEYQDSLENGVSSFSNNAPSEYQDLYKNYLAQVAAYKASVDQENTDRNSANSQAQNQKQQLQNSKSTINTQVGQYQQILNTINAKKTDNINDNPFKYIYSNYVSQINTCKTQSEREQVKEQVVNDINDKIQSLNSASRDASNQIAAVATSPSVSYKEANDKVLLLKEQTLANIKKNQASTQTKIDEVTAKLDGNSDELKNTKIKATDTGVIHLNTEFGKQKYIAKGTDVASIYPLLSKKIKLYLTFYIPASRISNIKVGQSVRYTASQNLAKPLVLIGKVKKIDTAPTPIHEISYVKVSAKIDPTKSQLSKIHYGLQGKSVIIVDKKTWFNYFKDKVLNN